ncbi:MAG: shikimate dehydrogenase [Elusimicrobia bacterium]|nr:shikimate dehydrogenase [Elusimicrobiota bacterium]
MKRYFAAVVGRPVRHSLSPRLFKLLAAELGRELRYRAVEVDARRLAQALGSARRGPWVGWNVTLPHKVRILSLLDGLDDSARAAGAANVVRFEDGRAMGYNTDAAGFLVPLGRAGFAVRGCRAVVLGAGGAGRAACLALTRAGARRVLVFNRTFENARVVAAGLGAVAGPLSQAAEAVREADLVVNATSLGLEGRGCPLAPGARFKTGALAYDLVYRPALTPFLAQARAGGAGTLGGLGMLVGQALETWRIWFGETVGGRIGRRVEKELEEFLTGKGGAL